MTPPATVTTLWPGRDGQPIACRETTRVLSETFAALAREMADTAEDATVLGVDREFVRAKLLAMVEAAMSAASAAVLILLAVSPARAADAWLPRPVAELQVLDKVDARTTTLTVRVGQQSVFRSLTLAVTACAVRPADQPADAAARLVITDSHPDAPGFTGWMLRSAPAVSMLEHPIYDVRVVGCHA